MKKSTAFPFAVALTLGVAMAAPAFAQEHDQPHPPRNTWSFSGPFGTFDRAQLQRGFKVYREVCSTCHSIEMLSFRNLAEPGGPGYSPAQAAAVAAEYKIPDIDDSGQPTERPGRPADTFPKPFANEAQARAANGVAPPDMSVLAKARTYERGFPWFLLDIFTQFQEQGPDYIVALMKGYREPPKDMQMPEASHYNDYFPGHVLKMPQPLSDGQVTYDDGSPQTVDQYAHDVAAFLVWVAEPHMEQRKRIGLQVMIFLIVFSGLLYFTKKKVWADVKAHPEKLQVKS
jgi:ubiquinol-cytochrome c reductase cytochrome b/c1 subunit